MDELIKRYNLKENYPLSRLTTLKIGGPARYFAEIKEQEDLPKLISEAKQCGVRYYIIGEGSNIVAPDAGFDGLVIRVKIEKLEIQGVVVEVGGGNNLLDFILRMDHEGLSGMEKMAGIPGSMAGAIFGNAGAYGQETQNCLVSVDFFDGTKVVTRKKERLGFGYRMSIFKKHKGWIILSAEFRFAKADSKDLIKTSHEIIEIRKEKYPVNLRYPGSFFKNILLATLPEDAQGKLVKLVPEGKIVFGKVPAGFLLDAVGARGMEHGGAAVTAHHANLIYNKGGATAADIKALAGVLKHKVFEKFGVMLEEEVQFLE